MYLAKGTELYKRYRIDRVLGHGGFGITYLARDPQLNIYVAIKEYLPRQLARRAEDQRQVSAYSGDDEKHFRYGLKKFLDEAQAIARFDNHPNIVNVKDYFEENGTAYMVMSYVDGVNLKTYLDQKGGKIPFELALNVMMPVMDALREVHGVGLLHRDVSPDNIYLSTRGQVILLDFGAARYSTSEYSQSISLILKGGYAPEEQYRRRGKQGAWTDEYSVAATLYKAVTGKTPPEAPDRKEHDTLVPPSQLGVKISPAAEQALLKALSIRAADRYRSILEFQQAIGRVTETDQVTTIRCPYCQTLNKFPAQVPREKLKCGKCHQPLGGSPGVSPSPGWQARIGSWRRALPPWSIKLLWIPIILGGIYCAYLLVTVIYDSWPQRRPVSGPPPTASLPSPLVSASPSPSTASLPSPLVPAAPKSSPSATASLPSPLVPASPTSPPPPASPPALQPVRPPAVQTEDYFNQGLTATDPSQKILFYQQAIKQNPDRAEVYNELGKIYQQMKDGKQALTYYDKAIKIKPDFAEAYNNLGKLYFDLSDYTNALANYNKAISLDPKMADAYYNRGMLYKDTKKFTLAQNDFSKAIKYKHNFAGAYYNRGIINFSFYKNYKSALKDFNNAIKFNPNNIEAYDYRGVLFFKLKDYDQALADFDRVISQKPAYADPYYNRGRIYYQRKQYRRALQDYDKVVSLKPGFAEAYFAKGRVYENMGLKDQARKEYRRGKALSAKAR